MLTALPCNLPQLTQAKIHRSQCDRANNRKPNNEWAMHLNRQLIVVLFQNYNTDTELYDFILITDLTSST